MTQPPPPPNPGTPPKKSNRMLWLILGGIALSCVIGLVVQVIGERRESDSAAAAVTTTFQPPAPPVAATTAPKLTRTATATPSPDFPAGLDPRCSQAPADLVEEISAKLNDPNHRVAHAVLLTSATGTPYIGASLVASDGLMIEKSDVWVNTKSRGMTAATAGARRNTDLPKTSDVLDIDLGGEDVQTADMCAWKWAQASGYN